MTSRRGLGPITLWVSLVAAVWLAAPSPAQATEPVLVASSTIRGSLTAAVVVQLEARLIEDLGKSEVEVATLTKPARRRAAACNDDDCRAQAITAANAGFLLVPEIALADGDYQLRLTLYDGAGATMIEVAETCSLCGLAEAVDLIGDLGARIGRKLDVASRASSLTITSEPAGARVFLHNVLVGLTPLELPIDAGVHSLRIELDGYIDLDRTIEIVAGEVEQLAVGLQPKPVRDLSPLLRGLGWGSLGLGVGVAAGGVALIMLDEQPITSACSGSDVDAAGECRWRHATLEAGIGLVAGSAVLIGAGIALLVVGHDRSRRRWATRVRPQVAGLSIEF